MANGTEAAGYGLNPLQSLADTHRAELLASCQSLRTSRFLLQDRPPSFQEHPPPEVGFGQQHAQPAGPSGNGSSDPKSKETPQNFSLLKDFILFFFFPRGSWQILSFASRPSWTKLLQRIPPAPLPLRDAIPREKWFHGDPLLSCI